MAYNNLDHLSEEEVEGLYQRYLVESSSELLKEFKLDSKRKGGLFGYFPELVKTPQPCPECNESLYSQRLKKNSAKDTELKYQCLECGYDEIEIEETADPIEALKRKIIDQYGNLKQHYLPFVEKPYYESYPLKAIVGLMSLIFAKWDENSEDDSIPTIEEEDAANIYPISNVDIVKACYNHHLLAIDIYKTNTKSYLENEDGTLSFYIFTVPYKSNLCDGDDKHFTIKEVHEWLSRKFADRYWYTAWDDQLLSVWLDLAVDECVSYAMYKANEYQFGFRSEAKLREIFRELLQDFSVSECYYFVSSAYYSAAAFYQSNKSKSRQHAENTVPGKILSIAKSGKCQQWDRDRNVPRSVFSQMLFDVILNTEGDYGFYHCPYKTYKKLLSREHVTWPPVSDINEVKVEGEYGYIDVVDRLYDITFIKSKDPLAIQLENLYEIAKSVGLEDAASEILEKLITK